MKKGLAVLLVILLLPLFAAFAEEGPVQTLSDDGRLIQEDYVTEDGRPKTGPGGFARRVLDYDDEGRVVRESFFDDQLAPAPNKDGVIVIERDYDGDKVVRARYLDADGAPMLYERLGAFCEAFEYDGA